LVPVESIQPEITAACDEQSRFLKHVDKVRILTSNPYVELASSWRFTQSSLTVDG